MFLSASMSYQKLVQNPRRQKALQVRKKVERGIREFFDQKGFDEVRTPLLVASPGIEIHLHPFELKKSSPCFLPTSPEFAMKKLLSGGMKKIYQLNSSFRDEPVSQTHLPEFTMLEWYDVDGFEAVMNQTQGLVASIATSISGSTEITYQNQSIDLSTPWLRFTTQELFEKHVGLKLLSDTPRLELIEKCHEYKIQTDDTDLWDDLYFKLWLNEIEPNLPKNRPCFVTDYPVSQAALSKVYQNKNNEKWARRFEAYIGGIELCNAFDELQDPKMQKKRFEEELKIRKAIYGNQFPMPSIDENLIQALEEGLPDCAGNALGVDRLVMLLSDSNDIRETVWLPEFA